MNYQQNRTAKDPLTIEQCARYIAWDMKKIRECLEALVDAQKNAAIDQTISSSFKQKDFFDINSMDA
jgi:hypothetical protein